MEQLQLNSTSIRTLSGLYVDVLNLNPEMLDINDIAHALSMMPRFGGHLLNFYSVAQHSYHVSLKVSEEQELAGLMHDASKFLIMDMPRPVKNQLSNYKELEHQLMKVISEKFGFEYPFHPEIKKADEIMLHKEWSAFVHGETEDKYFIPMSQPVAKMYFLKRFHELTNNKFK